MSTATKHEKRTNAVIPSDEILDDFANTFSGKTSV
jgi:hypothetical protein